MLNFLEKMIAPAVEFARARCARALSLE